MTKSAKIAIICLVAGILLLGIGGVMTFFNVSTVTYGGEKPYETESAAISETYTENIDSKVDNIHIYFNDRRDNWDVAVQEDESVSENEIAFDITRPGDVALWYNFTLVDQYNNSFDSVEGFNDYVRGVANGDFDVYEEYADDYYDDDYYESESAREYAHHPNHLNHDSQVLHNHYANNGADIRLVAEAYFDLDCNNNGAKSVIQAMKDLKESSAYYNYTSSGKIVIRINPANASKVVY